MFQKKPFTQRIKDTGFLIKHSFSIIGKDRDIIKPTIHMIVLSVFLTTLFFFSIISFITQSFVGLGIILALS